MKVGEGKAGVGNLSYGHGWQSHRKRRSDGKARGQWLLGVHGHGGRAHRHHGAHRRDRGGPAGRERRGGKGEGAVAQAAGQGGLGLSDEQGHPAQSGRSATN